MCPMCLATAALIAGSATSTGGFVAIIIRRFGLKSVVDSHPAPTPSVVFRKKNGATEIVPNPHPRRN